MGGLLFWASADKNKLSGDCSRNKGFSITIGRNKVYCDHEGNMWSYTLPGGYYQEEAVSACQDLVYAKTGGWELPDITTLEDLYTENYLYVVCDSRDLFGNFNFKNNWDSNVCYPSSPSGHYYWSSSRFGDPRCGFSGWGIFGYITSPQLFESDLKISVRCVKKASIVELYDENTCDKIQDQERKDYCYLKVAESRQNFSICKLIQDQKRKDSCYWRVARSRQDSSICDKIQDQKRKDYCYLEIATLKQDPSICDKIDGQEEIRYPNLSTKDICYQYIAVSKQDPSICDKIQEQFFRDVDCYNNMKLDLLSLEQSLAICDKIQQQSTKNHCYEKIAIYMKDKSICDKIQNEIHNGVESTFNGFTDKEWCYEHFK
ncbi:MAG: hypothetical protein PHG13_00970 [Candidatus Pacebacteria bacterium]|nr:hypothetical protein [Candidatus Paceibacterota bacterium]